MQDVENWFETEGSVATKTGIILITQRKGPLQKLRRALKKHANLTACPTLRSGMGGYAIQLSVEDSARFVWVFKNRVKTAKALRDLKAKQGLRRKRKRYRGPAQRATRILEGSSM